MLKEVKRRTIPDTLVSWSKLCDYPPPPSMKHIGRALLERWYLNRGNTK